MGIRFRCHHCEHELNLKNFQAGRRARCPVCSGRFRVPTESCDFSSPVDEDRVESAAISQSNLAGAVQTQAAQRRATTGQATMAAVASASAVAKPSAQPAAVVDDNAARAAGQSNATQGVQSGGLASVGADSASAASQAHPAVGSTPAPLLLADSWPAAIAEAPQAVWYLRPPGGGQYGPVDGAVFWQWFRENRVVRDAFVWRDGWPQWQLAAEAFADIFGPMVPMSVDSSHAAGPSEGLQLATATVEVATEAGTIKPGSESVVIRKKKGSKKKSYAWAIVALAVLAIALLAVLIGVLMFR